jgi:hypothetical protein
MNPNTILHSEDRVITAREARPEAFSGPATKEEIASTAAEQVLL